MYCKLSYQDSSNCDSFLLSVFVQNQFTILNWKIYSIYYDFFFLGGGGGRGGGAMYTPINKEVRGGGR